MTSIYLFKYNNNNQEWISLNLLANIKEIIAISFIKIFKAGPDVSFKGSPTVSPTTAALWISVPFVTFFPF